jgi:hypothetical protein
MRRLIGLAVVAGAFAFVACGNSNTKTPDKTVVKKDGLVIPGLEPSTNPGLEAGTKKDKGTGTADQDTESCGTPTKAKSNSMAPCGETCTTDATCIGGSKCMDTTSGKACASGGKCACECANSTDEVCVTGFKNAAGQAVAMCLGKCCADPNGNLDDDINLCPGSDINADPPKMATCAWGYYLPDDPNKSGICTSVCALKGSDGTIYAFDCPNKTDYDCIVDDPTNYPDDKICVPKK